jgi:hypothetical protein
MFVGLGSIECFKFNSSLHKRYTQNLVFVLRPQIAITNYCKASVKQFYSIRNLSLYCLVATGWGLASTVAFAAPVPTINNQAEGSYQDPIDPNKPFVVYSPPVKISLQEIAGITITANGISRQDGSLNGGAVGIPAKGIVLLYNFDIQNIGNETTQFFVPNRAQVGVVGQFQKVQYFNGTDWLDVPVGGLTSSTMVPNAKLSVRVVVSVNDAIGDLPVTLGKTAGSINPTQTQNQLRVDNAEDVYTVDVADGAVGEYDGLPSNGTREAQATQTLKVGNTPEALATINLEIKQPFNPADNTINFGLSLNVADTLPPNFSGISPTDLTGTNVAIDGQPKIGILIANAIPLGTKFVAVVTPDNTWVPIYFYSSTAIGSTDQANNAAWSTTPPDANTALNVRRVGFFRNDYRIPKGTTATGFEIKVEVTDFSRTEIYNIAQVFGTQPADPNNPADKTPSSRLIFDESGDSQPNNYNADGTAGVKDTAQQPILYPGILDATVPTNDPRSPLRIGQASSSSSSPDGEFLLVPFKAAAPPALKNGPREQPTAVGPTNDNDDFTNKSTPISNVVGALTLPLVTFTNTVLNSSDLSRNIKVLPQVAVASDLPDGTIVTLLDPADANLTTAFSYKNGAFTLVANSPATLVLKNVAAGATKNYTVQVSLPAGAAAIKGFPVKLLAFIDTNNDNIPDTSEAKNATVDRAYTGFIEVLKESRVLDANKNPLTGSQGIFSEIGKPVKVDQYIEYRITYTNISTPAVGTGNKPISAANFTITEDGNASPNNWGSLTDNDPDSAIGTSGTITYRKVSGAGTSADLDVVRYQNILTQSIEPGQTGTFTFRRKVK